MRRNMVGIVWTILLVSAGSQAHGQTGYGYYYPPRQAYPQWPAYPQVNLYYGTPQMAYPALAQPWYPSQPIQPVGYSQPVAPVAPFSRESVLVMPPAQDDPAPAPTVKATPAPATPKAVV